MKRGRKKITIDEDTLQRILDECYQETNDLKTEISNIYTVWNTKIVEIGEIAAVGKDVVKLLDQRDKVIDKKLKIAQQIHAVLAENTRQERAQLSKSKIDDKSDEPGYLPDELNDKIDQMIAAAKKGK